MTPTTQFNIHWIVGGRRKFLPKNTLPAVPHVGDEVRASDKEFYTVRHVVWCLDEGDSMGLGQRVNIGLEPIKLRKRKS